MADWKKLSRALALADGKIDVREATIIRREMLADGKIDRSELEWLLEVRKTATTCAPAFDQFVFEILTKVVLADGQIDAKEAGWLRKFIFADGRVDEGEKGFLRGLRDKARSVSPEFNQLLKEAGV